MSPDTFNIHGSVTGSNIGGHDNSVVNHQLVPPAELAQLFDQARAAARDSAAAPEAQDVAVAEIDGLQQDLKDGVAQDELDSRLARLKVAAEAVGITAAVVKIIEAVRVWFS